MSKSLTQRLSRTQLRNEQINWNRFKGLRLTENNLIQDYIRAIRKFNEDRQYGVRTLSKITNYSKKLIEEALQKD